MTTSSVTKKFQRRHVLCSAVVAATVLFSPSVQPSGHYFEVEAFTVSRSSPLLSPSSSRASHNFRLFSSADENQAAVEVEVEDTVSTITDGDDPTPSVVKVPLKFIGPYPCLALKFPNLATDSQRSKNQTGISLDFVLDTAANINTIQGQVAQELNLEVKEDSPALPGVSSSGPMAGGETYVLGDTELEQVEIVGGDELTDKEPFEFMQDLTAAVIPVVNPGSAGLLGLAFFYCFEGGVEFQWGAAPAMQQPQDSEPQLVDGLVVEPTIGGASSPSITFYGEESSELKNSLSELSRVPIEPIPLTQLPSVRIKVNGVEMVALLDTGSPVTVLNERAAKAAGVQSTRESMVAASDDTKGGGGGWNPFASVVDKFKEAQATAEAASKGEILMIGGIDGKPTNLYRSTGSKGPSISLVGSSDEDVLLGNDRNVYVGDIPGLAALNGIGVDSPPAVVLGLDVLRQRPRMVFRPRENELYI